MGNCPADSVSWYDTIAYCRWLTARLGHEVRLPAEWEWQQGATGGRPDCVYPWGSDWVEGCANTWESRLSRTTAVGMYPAGTSAQKALDVAGNVWEWCLNQHDRKLDGEVPRVIRGGVWNSARDLARCAYRLYSRSNSRSNGVGFRLCASPPSPDPPISLVTGDQRSSD